VEFEIPLFYGQHPMRRELAATAYWLMESRYRATVLLGEDDPDDVLLTQLAFEKARLANPLIVVRDGEEVISYLKGEGAYADREKYPLPILLLLDLKMPKISGFQVLEWLRTRRDLSDISVAIMTSSDSDPDMSRAYQLGASSYLVKPPDAEALLALVQRLHAYWLILDEKTLSMAA
jgi:CheY-like chemotaxis protein